jgi:hypothetical protein
MENKIVSAGEKSIFAKINTMAPTIPTTIPTQLKYLADACKWLCLKGRLPTGMRVKNIKAVLNNSHWYFIL